MFGGYDNFINLCGLESNKITVAINIEYMVYSYSGRKTEGRKQLKNSVT